MIIGIFLQIPLNKKEKRERYREEMEERIISLIASLFGKLASKTHEAEHVLVLGISAVVRSLNATFIINVFVIVEYKVKNVHFWVVI